MMYKIRRVWLDNSAEIIKQAKRRETIIWPVELRVGGLYHLREGKLYRVEEVIKT